MAPFPANMPAYAALAAMLVAACATDVARHRIPNALVAAGVAVGLGLSMLPGGIGIASASGGVAAGFAMLMPLYLLRAMGAGDVKLMAAVGAFAGWPDIVGAALFSLIAGGALSLGWAIATRTLPGVLGNVRTGLYLSFARVLAGRMPTASDVPLGTQRMPYALAIAAGTAAYVIAYRAG